MMSSKSTFKLIMEGFIERSIILSPYLIKLVDNIVILTKEFKKITEAIFVLNNRLNEHEQLLLKLAELYRNKSSETHDAFKDGQKQSKPN